MKKIPNPAYRKGDKYFVNELSVTPDEKYVMHNDGNVLYIVDLETSSYEKISFPARLMPPVVQSPAEPKLLFSDGLCLFTCDLHGNNLVRVTELSMRYKAEANPLIHRYFSLKKKILQEHCD